MMCLEFLVNIEANEGCWMERTFNCWSFGY